MVQRGFVVDGELDVAGVLAELARPRVAGVLWFTLWSSALATALTLLLGVPTAYALHRLDLPGAAVMRGLVTVPFVLPTVVVGVAFRTLLAPGGPLGGLGLGRHPGGHRGGAGLLQPQRRGADGRPVVGLAGPAARAGRRRARRLAGAGVPHRDAAGAAPGPALGRLGGVPLLRDRVRGRAHPRRHPLLHGRDRDLPAHHPVPRPPGRGGALGAPGRRGRGAAPARRPRPAARQRGGGPGGPAAPPASARCLRRASRSRSPPSPWPSWRCRWSRWWSARCGWPTPGRWSATARCRARPRRSPLRTSVLDAAATSLRTATDATLLAVTLGADRVGARHPPPRPPRAAPGRARLRRRLHAAARASRR